MIAIRETPRMEVDPPPNVAPLLLPFEDDSRMARTLLLDDAERPRAASADTRINDDALYPSNGTTHRDDSPSRVDDGDDSSLIATATLLSLEETTQLFKSKIEDARKDSEQVFDSGEEVDEAVKPKLTLDLGHSNITRLPEGVVDLIKLEVERLSLSHNRIWHIPLRFSECTYLRYLNIKSNVFREIPRGVYKLQLLEILDISKNKIRKIGKEIKNLTSLRVFSIIHNRVDDLPPDLCEMNKLQIIKVAENPLRFKLKKIVEAKETEVQDLAMNDNEKEYAVTSEIKRYLRETHRIRPVDVESGGEFSEGPGDTPRPLRRVMSSRFPVIPSGTSTSSETNSEIVSRSPGQSRPPPIPTRSHFRGISGQNSIGLRRPGLNPVISNERIRSNSESVLQASNAARNRRTVFAKREKSDLEPVEENKPNRLSHLRGYSHGSVLRARSSNFPSSPGAQNSASPNSPRDVRRNRQGFVKRLSSLPEHKSENGIDSLVVEGAKGILYALYQVHPHIAGLIAVLNGKDVKRSSLEFTFYNACTHFDRLNEAIEAAETLEEDDEDALEKAEDAVQRDCTTCIMAYTHVAAQLQDAVQRIVSGIDGRYVRTLMLMLYGSMIEIKNAISNFGVEVVTYRESPQTTSPQDHRATLRPMVQEMPPLQEVSTPQPPVRTMTPTRERAFTTALTTEKQVRRLRSDTTIQHPNIDDFVPQPPRPPFAQDQMPSKQPSRPSTPLTGSTLHGGSYHKSIPSYESSGGSQNSIAGPAMSLRSRSNSRNAYFMHSTTSSLAPSIASTPRSGEAFNLPPPNHSIGRVNPNTGLTDAQEEACFEQVFLALTRAYDAALQTIPIARRQFVRCLEVAEDSRSQKEIRELWSTLIWRCKSCLDASESLKSRLINMRLKDPAAAIHGAGSSRDDPAFWQLCKNFMQNFVELVTEMKEAKDIRLLPAEIVVVLRPVQRASRDAGKLIRASPWRHLADAGANRAIFFPPQHSQVTPAMPGNAFANAGVVMNGVNGANGIVQSYASNLQQQQQQQQQQHHPHLQQSPFPPPIVPVPPLPNGATGPVSASSVTTNGTSPVSVPLPATPLSAALGPAAQATVPSTPSLSSAGEHIFHGNVFQRADTLLSMSQNGNVNFLNRR